MPNNQPMLDRVFHALANPTRRAVLQRLSRRPTALTTLAQPFHMALPSLLQHLRVLEHSGLVRSSKRGRTRTYQLAPRALTGAERWLTQQRRLWERRLDQPDRYLLTIKEQSR
jgi:DNA-binding transcriptional ArsR family regulator